MTDLLPTLLFVFATSMITVVSLWLAFHAIQRADRRNTEQGNRGNAESDVNDIREDFSDFFTDTAL